MKEELERFGLFEGLTPQEFAAITRISKAAKFKKGERVFQVGDPATSLFLLCRGSIELRFKVTYYNATVEIPLERDAQGEVFGWSAVTHPHRYTLSAYAAEDSELLQITQEDIRNLCEANLHLGYVFMKNISQIIAQRLETIQAALTKEIQDELKQKDSLA